MVFAPIPFQPEAILPSPEPAAPAADQAEPTETAPAPEYGSHHIRVLKVDGLPSTRPKSARKEFDTQKLSWNPYKHCLAFVSGKNQVTVQDFEDSDAKEPCSLTSDHQTNVKAIGWRPNSGKMIAVACKCGRPGGLCLWSASYPGNVPL